MKLRISFFSSLYIILLQVCNLNHSSPYSFLIHSFSTQSSQLFQLICFNKDLNKSKRAFFVKYQNLNQGKFETDIKLFLRNNLLMSIVLVWFLLIVNLLSFFPVLTHSNSKFYYVKVVIGSVFDSSKYVFRGSKTLKTSKFSFQQREKKTMVISKICYSKKPLNTATLMVASNWEIPPKFIRPQIEWP